MDTSMTNHKFTAEFELRASSKMVYPYLNTPSGLAQWFADDVQVDEDKFFHFIWDSENHKARLTAQKLNHYVKFEFLPDSQEEDNGDHPYIELRLDTNDLTGTTFLKVIDYSAEDDEELLDIWENIVYTLRETVGG